MLDVIGEAFSFAKPSGVNGNQPSALVLDTHVHRVSGRASDITDNGTLFATECIQQAALARISFAHNGEPNIRGCFNFRLWVARFVEHKPHSLPELAHPVAIGGGTQRGLTESER